MDNPVGENLLALILTLLMLGSCGIMIYMMVAPDSAGAFTRSETLLFVE
jgi:uncharacterized membrane protein